MDDTCASPSINSTVFPATVSDYTWTSTTYAADPTDAWVVSFLDVDTSADFKSRDHYVARLVRSGQSFDALATCNLELNGNGQTTADQDGVLLLRFLLGFRGAALVAGVPINAVRGNAEDMANFIGWAGKYDVFGRPIPTALATTDGVVLLRLMTGVPDDALLIGVVVPSGASFATGGTVRANVNAKCGTQF